MGHQSLFVFDIETVPDTDAVPNLIGLDAGAGVAERREALDNYHLEITGGKNAFPRQPFHKVVAVSFLSAEIERTGRHEVYYLKEIRSGGKADSPEHDLVAGFFKWLDQRRPRLVSYNGRGFDIPVLGTGLWCTAFKPEPFMIHQTNGKITPRATPKISTVTSKKP